MDRNENREHDNYDDEGPIEIALVGDLTDNEADLTDRLLSVPPNGECVLFIDSPGGSPYCAVSLTTLIRIRGIRATGIVTGECSSATLWPFAACVRRVVTPYSVMLFHPMKWQSEEHVGLQEAAEWARHFGALERDMDQLLADLLGVDNDILDDWINPGRYVTGREFADAGLAEMISIGTNPTHQKAIMANATPTNGNGKRESVKSENGNGSSKQPGSLGIGTSSSAGAAT